jgi:hypothetical protein
MSKRASYSQPHDLSALHDELIAAGIRPTYVGGSASDPDRFVLELPDDADEGAVAAVLAAHDKPAAVAKRQAAQQAERDEDTQVRGLVAQLDDAIATASGAGTLTAAHVKAGLLLALRAIRMIVRHELRRRGGA